MGGHLGGAGRGVRAQRFRDGPVQPGPFGDRQRGVEGLAEQVVGEGGGSSAPGPATSTFAATASATSSARAAAPGSTLAGTPGWLTEPATAAAVSISTQGCESRASLRSTVSRMAAVLGAPSAGTRSSPRAWRSRVSSPTKNGFPPVRRQVRSTTSGSGGAPASRVSSTPTSAVPRPASGRDVPSVARPASAGEVSVSR